MSPQSARIEEASRIREMTSTTLDQEAASTEVDVTEPSLSKPGRLDEDDCDNATAVTAMSWSCFSQAAGEGCLDESTSSSTTLAEVNKIEEEKISDSSTGQSECFAQARIASNQYVSSRLGSKVNGEGYGEGAFKLSSSESPTVARKSPVSFDDSVRSPCQIDENSQLGCECFMVEKVSQCSAMTSTALLTPTKQDSSSLSVRDAPLKNNGAPQKAKQESVLSTSEKLAYVEDCVRNKSMNTHGTFSNLDDTSAPYVPGPLIDLEAAASATCDFDRPGAYVVRTTLAPSREQRLTSVTVAGPSTYLVEASLVVDDASSRGADGVGTHIVEAKPIKETSTWKSRRIQCAVFWIVFLTSGAAVGITVGLMINQPHDSQTLARNQDTQATTAESRLTPTASPSQAPRTMDMMIEELQSSLPLYTLVALKNEDSPQAKALQWIREHPPIANNSVGRMTQRFALATVFYSTYGDHWDQSAGWLNGTSHECDWFTTSSSEKDSSCDPGDDSIVTLRLVQNSLDGTIPSELALITSLRTLQLELNPFLNGTIPTALQSTPLTEVFLNENGLSGTLPEFNPNITAFLAWENNLVGRLPLSYANWTRLDRFSVRSNMISGLFSENIFSHWIMATSIDVSDNKFNGSISTQIGLLSCLTTLSLKTNNFTGQVPSELGRLEGLHELYLGENRFTGTVPSELGNAQRLQVLDFESNFLTGSIPTELELLTNLEELKLGGNSLVGPLPDALISLEHARVLSFGQNSLNGTIPAALAPHSSVQILSLHQNQFTGTIPMFGNFTSLIELRLNENKLTGTLPTELGLLRSLELLDLEGNLLSGGIPSELGSLENIKELILSDNNLNGTVPVELCALIESNNAKVEIDCDRVECDCGCTCCGTDPDHT